MRITGGTEIEVLGATETGSDLLRTMNSEQ